MRAAGSRSGKFKVCGTEHRTRLPAGGTDRKNRNVAVL